MTTALRRAYKPPPPMTVTGLQAIAEAIAEATDERAAIRGYDGHDSRKTVKLTHGPGCAFTGCELRWGLASPTSRRS